jgi:hypothetical protein
MNNGEGASAGTSQNSSLPVQRSVSSDVPLLLSPLATTEELSQIDGRVVSKSVPIHDLKTMQSVPPLIASPLGKTPAVPS